MRVDDVEELERIVDDEIGALLLEGGEIPKPPGAADTRATRVLARADIGLGIAGEPSVPRTRTEPFERCKSHGRIGLGSDTLDATHGNRNEIREPELAQGLRLGWTLLLTIAILSPRSPSPASNSRTPGYGCVRSLQCSL